MKWAFFNKCSHCSKLKQNRAIQSTKPFFKRIWNTIAFRKRSGQNSVISVHDQVGFSCSSSNHQIYFTNNGHDICSFETFGGQEKNERRWSLGELFAMEDRLGESFPEGMAVTLSLSHTDSAHLTLEDIMLLYENDVFDEHDVMAFVQATSVVHNFQGI
ncbi:hypothetical protein SUGI_0751130 [Cryptomeria japonica]|nr:hypothetical protein SUGI_0751130 [Cryptomeria japonica]